MKCDKCGSTLQINNKGLLYCPTCDNSDNQIELVLQHYKHNYFEFYKIIQSKNYVGEEILFKDDLEELLKKNSNIKIKEAQ